MVLSSKLKKINFFSFTVTSSKIDMLILYLYIFLQFDPDVMILDWCVSDNGDLAQLFRRTPFLSKMVITHDLRTITNNPALKLDANQEAFLKKIGKGCSQI